MRHSGELRGIIQRCRHTEVFGDVLSRKISGRWKGKNTGGLLQVVIVRGFRPVQGSLQSDCCGLLRPGCKDGRSLGL